MKAFLYSRVRAWWSRHRDRRADRLRRQWKRQFLIDDAHKFFAGKITAVESWERRQRFYRILDEMTTDEVLSI
jgi:hypothetical protein